MKTRHRQNLPVVCAGRVDTAICRQTRLFKAPEVVFKGVSSALAFNSLTPGASFGLALNITATPVTRQTASDWLEVAPYHEGPYWQEESGTWVQYKQVFTKPQADAMVAAFNATAMKKGSTFKGLPVFAGHPDADPQRWPDERRLGGIVNLEARKDGLYARVAWNVLGRQNQEEGFLVYPSPAWLYDKAAAQSTRTIRPNELSSIGMTNVPRIADVKAWTNRGADHGDVGPGFRRLAFNASLSDGKLPPILHATSPAKQGEASEGGEPDLSTAAGRTKHFNERLDQLTAPRDKGGSALTFNDALAQMKTNPADKALLKAMGA